MIDLFNIFINLVLALALGYGSMKLLYGNKTKKCCPYKMGLLVVVYFLVLHNYVLTDYRMNSVKFFKETFLSSNNNNNNNQQEIPTPQLDVPKDTFMTSVDDYHGTKMPIMGPLDGLPWQEVIRRVNYLKAKTQYPYKPMTYTDYKTSMDELLGEDLSGLMKHADLNTTETKQELRRWYPDSTLNQINARDCTNYAPGHPLSCVQPSTKLSDDLLLNDSTNPTELATKENFISSDMYKSTQELLNSKSGTMPTLFKNAPGHVGQNVTRDISSDLCRGCVVGQCSKGVCGSRVIEPGNENIIDVEGYVKSYLDDNVPLSDEKNKKEPVNPWTFF
jgi:hypothetical protein